MNSIAFPAAAVSPDPTMTPRPVRAENAPREFEASLIASLLESLEKTFATVPGETDLPGADNYNYLGTQALAEGIAAHGGFGIAAMISPHLAPHEGKGSGESSDWKSRRGGS